MPAPIGIVSCSAPGAALCYQTLCTEAEDLLGRHEHPEISLHAFSFADHARAAEAGDWPAVSDLLLRSVEKLAAIGAKIAICPDNTAHLGLPAIRGRSPIPWIHIAEVVAERARSLGVRKVGILGTRYLVESTLYPDALEAQGIGFQRPPREERERLNTMIFDELVYGDLSAQGRLALRSLAMDLIEEHGCDALILGCTELPLALHPQDVTVPLLDSTRLLARAALERSVA